MEEDNCIDPYRSLLVEISREITKKELKEMIFLCGGFIPDGRKENLQDALDFFEELEKQNKISKRDLIFLKGLLEKVNRSDIAKKMSDKYEACATWSVAIPDQRICYRFYYIGKETVNAEKPVWCKCGTCRKMPSSLEKNCCNQTHACITTHTLFGDIITDVSLWANCYGPYLANEDIRKEAYRRYSYYTRGRLGRGCRKALPSCVVWEIRGCFPDKDGQYEGFKPH